MFIFHKFIEIYKDCCRTKTMSNGECIFQYLDDKRGGKRVERLVGSHRKVHLERLYVNTSTTSERVFAYYFWRTLKIICCL